MTVITRFAPSPTGYLHLGGARTALFSWLYARHQGGKFLLRIEDTDRERSTQPAIDAILKGMEWLGLEADEPYLLQSTRDKRHAEIAHQLLAEGRAYYCYCSPEELQNMRDKAKAEGKPMGYDGRWRNKNSKEAPEGIKPVVRLKANQSGETILEDLVQGRIVVQNEQLDDMVLLRSDGTPTYMLSVVVDDHDSGITHVIRGDDHLNNTFRQIQLYEALGWAIPRFAHIPLIHGEDGAKLSKRHGAVGIEYYRDAGFLPEAFCNYLLRMGWSHGDDEIIARENAIKWFDLDHVGKSPSRFDLKKLEFINAHYMKQKTSDELLNLLEGFLDPLKCHKNYQERLLKALPFLKERAKTLVELKEISTYLWDAEWRLSDETQATLVPKKDLLKTLVDVFRQADFTTAEALQNTLKTFCEQNNLAFKDVGPFMRLALTGNKSSPGNIAENLGALGLNESLKRLDV
jgi:glutamyl-tRNA synthetase